MEYEEQTETLFENLISHVGFNGKFQKRFNLAFNVVFAMFLSMQFLNLVLALSVPQHWCHLPGRNDTNFTEEEWKRLTIPREKDEFGKETYSKCKMYNFSMPINATSFEKDVITRDIVDCQFGWDYDHTWYTRTLVTQYNWVCDKELHVTNTLLANRAGDVIGILAFGQLGDIGELDKQFEIKNLECVKPNNGSRIKTINITRNFNRDNQILKFETLQFPDYFPLGRRTAFLISAIVLVFGRCLIVFTAENFPLFIVSVIIGSLSQTQAFENPLVLAVEMSSPEKRAHIAMLQTISWTLGMCIMPFIAWITGDWIMFLIITSVPCGAVLIAFNWFPESARWLAAKGKTSKCLQTLHKIAKTNGTTLPSDAMLILQKIASKKERTYGLASLFSSWRLAKNTVLLSFLDLVTFLSVFTLLLNVSNLSGNPFLNYFWLSVMELPAALLGRYLADKFGRRWTLVSSLLTTVLVCFAVVITVQDEKWENTTTGLVILIKMGMTIPFYVKYLIAAETYPTCIRESGMAVCLVSGGAMALLGPYLVYLGTKTDARYPYIFIGILCISGGIASAFLPETLHQKLPETLADAEQFGKHQTFWSVPKKPERTSTR